MDDLLKEILQTMKTQLFNAKMMEIVSSHPNKESALSEIKILAVDLHVGANNEALSNLADHLYETYKKKRDSENE